MEHIKLIVIIVYFSFLLKICRGSAEGRQSLKLLNLVLRLAYY